MNKKKVIRIFERKNVKFWGKILKKVVQKFFGQMCSDEFFLKHALCTKIGKNEKIILFRTL